MYMDFSANTHRLLSEKQWNLKKMEQQPEIESILLQSKRFISLLQPEDFQLLFWRRTVFASCLRDIFHSFTAVLQVVCKYLETSVQTTDDCSNLLATKAITSSFLLPNGHQHVTKPVWLRPYLH